MALEWALIWADSTDSHVKVAGKISREFRPVSRRSQPQQKTDKTIRRLAAVKPQPDGGVTDRQTMTKTCERLEHRDLVHDGELLPAQANLLFVQCWPHA